MTSNSGAIRGIRLLWRRSATRNDGRGRLHVNNKYGVKAELTYGRPRTEFVCQAQEVHNGRQPGPVDQASHQVYHFTPHPAHHTQHDTSLHTQCDTSLHTQRMVRGESPPWRDTGTRWPSFSSGLSMASNLLICRSHAFTVAMRCYFPRLACRRSWILTLTPAVYFWSLCLSPRSRIFFSRSSGFSFYI